MSLRLIHADVTRRLNRSVDMQVVHCISSTRSMADTDIVFKALADRSRRMLLDRLNAKSEQTLTELCAGLDITRQAVTQHLAVLEAAHLVATSWRGREKLHFLNPVPLQEICDRWISKFERSRLRALRDLKRRRPRAPSASSFSARTPHVPPPVKWTRLAPTRRDLEPCLLNNVARLHAKNGRRDISGRHSGAVEPRRSARLAVVEACGRADREGVAAIRSPSR